jgi:1-hydroxycarotenoid 3,4-desaturase
VRLRAGEELEADAVIVNAAPQAVDEGLLGGELADAVGVEGERSLSAVTWSTLARARGFELTHHNVFFSSDYPAEFRALGRDELIEEPTVYVCAQDRDAEPADPGAPPERRGEPERLLVLVNAPARGDDPPWTPAELDALEARSFELMRTCGLELDVEASVRTSPREFEALFPATGGALYGLATHTMTASFKRPAARAKLRRLYLAGGGAHPGAGIPMVCLSGQLAGRAALADLGLDLPRD